MFGHWEIIIVLVLVLIIFGAGRLPRVMGDLGKGIKAFKGGLNTQDSEKIEESESEKDAMKPHKAKAPKKSTAKKA